MRVKKKKSCVFALGTHSKWTFLTPKQCSSQWMRSNQYGVKSACFRLFQFHLFKLTLLIIAISALCLLRLLLLFFLVRSSFNSAVFRVISYASLRIDFLSFFFLLLLLLLLLIRISHCFHSVYQSLCPLKIIRIGACVLSSNVIMYVFVSKNLLSTAPQLYTQTVFWLHSRRAKTSFLCPHMRDFTIKKQIRFVLCPW